MTTPLSQERIQGMRERLALVADVDRWDLTDAVLAASGSRHYDFIANAPEDVAALLEEVGRLKGERDEAVADDMRVREFAAGLRDQRDNEASRARTALGRLEREEARRARFQERCERAERRVEGLEGVLRGFAIPQAEILREKAATDEARDVCDRVLAHLQAALAPAPQGEGGGGGDA